MSSHAPSHQGSHGIQPAGFGTHLIAIEGLTLLFTKSQSLGGSKLRLPKACMIVITARMFKQPRVPVLTYWTWCRHAEQSVGRAVALLDLRLGTLLVVGLTTKTEYSGFDPYLLSIHHQNYKMIKLSGFITMQFLQASPFHRYRKYMNIYHKILL